MFELLDDWNSILNALIAAPIAWQSPAELATTLGLGIEETTDLLSVMDEANWVSVWDVEPGPLITLSTLAAHRLKVVLVEAGPEEWPRWGRVGEPIPPSPKAGEDIALTEHFARQDHLLDPEPSPEDAAEKFEPRGLRVTGVRPRFADPLREQDLPRPTLLLGQNLVPWPGPEEFAGAALCPACAGRPLRPYMYCLGCDRWGLDKEFEKLAPQGATARAVTRVKVSAVFDSERVRVVGRGAVPGPGGPEQPAPVVPG